MHAAERLAVRLPQEQQGTATGSGFVIDKDGHILTNAHVVEGATQDQGHLQRRQDRRRRRCVGADPIDRRRAAEGRPRRASTCTPLELGDSSKVEVGDPVVAIGNPFGLDRTLTTGIVSRAPAHRSRRPTASRSTTCIQTDAAINPGNSGGPLIDGHGRVIGINSQIATGGSGGGNVGIGFAVPIDTAKKIVAGAQGRRQGRARLPRHHRAITIAEVAAKRLNLAVARRACSSSCVVSGGPAEKAGIKGGDDAGRDRRRRLSARRRRDHQDRRQDGQDERRRGIASSTRRSPATRSRSQWCATATRSTETVKLGQPLGERPTARRHAAAGQPDVRACRSHPQRFNAPDDRPRGDAGPFVPLHAAGHPARRGSAMPRLAA